MDYRVIQQVSPALVDAASAGDTPTICRIEGKCCPFEKWSYPMEIRARLQEKLIRTSFDQTIRLIKQGRKIVKMMIDHNPKQTITDTSPKTAGRLNLEARQDGLYFISDLPDTLLGQAVKRMIKRKQLNGVSIGFELKGAKSNITERPPTPKEILPAPKQNPESEIEGSDYVTGKSATEPNTTWRVLTNVDLKEISLLSAGKLPAYPETMIEERANNLAMYVRIYDALV